MFINWRKVHESFSQLQDFSNNVATLNHCAWAKLEGEQTHHAATILWNSLLLCNLPMDYWHVIFAWDSIPKAMKTFQSLTVRLLKEEILTKLFAEQDSGFILLIRKEEVLTSWTWRWRKRKLSWKRRHDAIIAMKWEGALGVGMQEEGGR